MDVLDTGADEVGLTQVIGVNRVVRDANLSIELVFDPLTVRDNERTLDEELHD